MINNPGYMGGLAHGIHHSRMCAHVHGFGDPVSSAIHFWQYYQKEKVLLEFVVDC